MKIAIDISQIIYETGVSVYTKNLVENLLKIDNKNKYVLFGGSLRRINEIKNFYKYLHEKNLQKLIFPIPPTLADLIWNRLHILPIETFTGKVDIFHSSDWSQPPAFAKKVTTIHDLVPFKFPELSHPNIIDTHKRRLKFVIREVDRIISPSETTKADLIELGIKERKISVIPEAPDPIYKPATRKHVESIKKKFGIKANYLLAIGVSQRKNIDRIVEAYENLSEKSDLLLVVLGEPKMKVKQSKGVIYLGHINRTEMPTFYSGAEALIYPSLYEGFGLPILEAFKCRTPVVTSNFGSMKEVAGDAAIKTDPYNIDSITEGIRLALRIKEEMIRSGVERSKEFTWFTCAKETLKVYSDCYYL